ncbi:MAG TPA: hypothetical protein VE525_01040 [Rubrobacter sp.]|jgi:hypothetical protein|nr:hypothetical protein [Rubrobacter sp.]
MTDKNSFADKVRDHTTDDSPRAHRAPNRRRWTDVMKHNWLASVVPPILIPRLDPAPESCARRRR